jgi:hypothetical protein
MEGARRTTALPHVHRMLRAGKAVLELTFPLLPDREYRPQAVRDSVVRFIRGTSDLHDLHACGRACLAARHAVIENGDFSDMSRIFFAAVKLAHLVTRDGALYRIDPKDAREFIAWIHPLNPKKTDDGRREWESDLNAIIIGTLSK